MSRPTRRAAPLDGLDSLEDPRLKTARIGVVAGTPPVTYLAIGGLLPQIKSYALMVDTRFDSPAQQMMTDLEKGDIDVALLWGPLAGYYAGKSSDADSPSCRSSRSSNGPKIDLPDRHGRAPFGPELEAHAQQADRRQPGARSTPSSSPTACRCSTRTIAPSP